MTDTVLDRPTGRLVPAAHVRTGFRLVFLHPDERLGVVGASCRHDSTVLVP